VTRTTRNVDVGVGHYRAKKAAAVRDGRLEDAAQADQDLQDAKLLAAAKALAAAAPALSPDRLERLVDILAPIGGGSR
jgi:hypothetical protein